MVTTPMLSRFVFRPTGGKEMDEHNPALGEAINADGRIYVTQTRVDGRVAIRFQVGKFEATEADDDAAYDVITRTAEALK